MKKITIKIILFTINIAIRIYKKINREGYNPRVWSNRELKKIAHLFSGDIINVSAGGDSDKENNYYKDYFQNKKSYTISNYKKTNLSTNYNEIVLDLEQNLSKEMHGKFDAVFTHTVLEHVYDMDKAIENLCNLSKNTIITIVPFLQTYHHEEENYYDFWRFSPLALIKKFNKYNFKTVYINWNRDPLGNIYILHVSSCKSKDWGMLTAFNTQDNQYAPGFQRNQLHSRLNRITDSVLIKTLDNILE